MRARQKWACVTLLGVSFGGSVLPHFNSTAISRAEYDESTGALSLWFVESGGPYHYYNVPLSVYEGLLAASSKGGYFNSHIRDRYGR